MNPKTRDRHRRPGHEVVAKQALAREARDHFAHHAHAGQDHDIDRRVRVEPEQVLEEQRIASHRGIENADAERALECHEREGDREHWRSEHEDDARGVDGPDEERQPEPCQPRRAHLVDGDDEIEPGRDRAKARDEDSRRHRNDVAIRIGRTVGRVERPAGIDPAGDDREERERATRHEQIPTREIQSRECHVARADHEGHEKIPQHRRDRGDEKEPDHYDAVDREEFVVGRRCDEVGLRGQQFEPHQSRRSAADEKEQRDRHHIEQADALVVGGEQPRADRSSVGEIVLRRLDGQRQFARCGVHRFFPSAFPSDLR